MPRRIRYGKRERAAGKRRRRALWSFYNGTEWVTLKLGAKKLSSRIRTEFASGGGRYRKLDGQACASDPTVGLAPLPEVIK